jgi:autotransporter-associated beta strand protein
VLAGSAGITKTTEGTVILSGSNTYSGTTTISAGTLQIGNGGTSGNLESGWIFNNSTIAFNRSDSLTVSNNISGTGSLRQLGSGTLILTQNAGFTGGISISAGTLQLGNGDTSDGSIAGNVTNNGTIIFNRGTVAMGGNISGTGNLIKLGNSLIMLQGSNSYTGATTVSAGTLSAGSANAFGSNSAITVSSGASLDNGGYNISIGSLSGSGNVQLYTKVITLGGDNSTTMFSGSIASWSGGGLMKTGTGTFILSGNNTYTGETVINSGTLATLGNERLANTGAVTVNSGATFKLGGNETIASLSGAGTADVGANRLTLSSGSFSGALAGSGDLYKTGADALTLSGTSTGYTGDLYLQGGSVVAGSSTALNANNFVLLSAGSTFTANQNLVLGGIDQNGGTIDGTGVITAVSTITRSGALNSVLGDVTGYNSGVLKLGTGTTTLGAANTYTGTTKVSEGTLALGANGSFASTSSAQIASGATLDLAAKSQTLADVKANGTIAGSGIMTVTGTLNGSGTINADTVVTGIHSPGNSPGIQTFLGNLTYQSGAGILLEFADNTTVNSQLAYDQILVGKDLNFSGLTSLNISFGETGSAVDWNNTFWQTSQSWTLYSVSGITTGFENLTLNSTNWSDANGDLFSDVLSGGTFSLAQSGKDIVLNYAIPEPSTYALMGLGALALVIAYRRKRA